jgi:cell division protein ZapE
MSGPLQRYLDGVSRGEYKRDESQEVALRLLQKLFDDIDTSADQKPPGLLSRLVGKKSNPALVRGLYFWGGVGRGKTFLMDLFYEELPIKEKKRLHFHRFMREVHRKLRDFQGEPNPLKKVAASFAGQARVICLDEFFVSDITDAMLLAGLLDEMFRLGVTLVVTSNVQPDHLYKNGLQRKKFLPAIELLNAHTLVHNLDGGLDYRLRALESAEIYHCPLDDAAEIGLQAAFRSISPDEGKIAVVLPIEGRDIASRRCSDGVVWFEFAALCDGPRSQNDYIELARLFQTVLVGNVPKFGVKKEDQARRFISLVDEFYDRSVKLIISAECPILDLYQGQRLAFEFQRTESRLQEMQSKEYLARQHKP